MRDKRDSSKKKYLSQTFPIKDYENSLRKAKAAAREWRDKNMPLLGYNNNGALPSHFVMNTRPNKRGDKSLPNGIFEDSRMRADGGLSYFFVISIQIAPYKTKKSQISYDASTPGAREKALRKAKRLRREWERTYYGT